MATTCLIWQVRKPYIAQFWSDGESIHLGRFFTAEEAALAWSREAAFQAPQHTTTTRRGQRGVDLLPARVAYS